MPKGFAIHNAPTDHGGIIPATQMRSSQMGNLFILVGDGHFCPKCKCWSTVIKSHDHVTFDGKAVAYAGDKLTCGAMIQPQQSHVVGDSGDSYLNSPTSSTLALQNGLPQEQENIFDEKITLQNTSGEPYSNFNYIVTFEDGSTQIGKTDSDGNTERLITEKKLKIITIDLIIDSKCNDSCSCEA